MVEIGSLLLFGFVLGMRHATDGDHVAAVATLVAREPSAARAAWLGVVWGLGHGATILVVGGAIVLAGLVIPPHAAAASELAVALMLLVLGAMNLAGTRAAQSTDDLGDDEGPAARRHAHRAGGRPGERRALGSALVGVVHGLAGSAAVALLALGAVRSEIAAFGYLIVFGAGTIAGMALISAVLAAPVAALAPRSARARLAARLASGGFSVLLAVVLAGRVLWNGG